MSSQSRNYVRTFRRRSSLGQQDLAFLLGSKDRTKVCRYEHGRRIPSLRNALRLATIFDTTLGTLFSGLQREAYRDVVVRIALLHSVLKHRHAQGRLPPSLSRQLRWLENSLARLHSGEHQPT
jgi:transcriptional regulator with XRE-family HTH domain